MTGQSVGYVATRCYQVLEKANDPEPDQVTWHVLSHVLEWSWERGYRQVQDDYHHYQQQQQRQQQPNHGGNNTSSVTVLTTAQSQQLQHLLYRRLTTLEPLQYLVGQWDFYQSTFTIRPPLLCPRPETEELVHHVLTQLQQRGTTTKSVGKLSTADPTTDTVLRLLDVGCGTGCIGISILQSLLQQQQQVSSNNNNTFPWSSIQVTAIDVEPIAIATSLENAHRVLSKTVLDTDLSVTTNNTAVVVEKPTMDGPQPLASFTVCLVGAEEYTGLDDDDPRHRFDVVVSNPPYIPTSDMETLDPTVLHHESWTALCGDVATDNSAIAETPSTRSKDGMDIIRTIVDQLPFWCHVTASCWMEVDPSQPTKLQVELEDNPFVDFVHSYTDFCGRDRFVQIRVAQTRHK